MGLSWEALECRQGGMGRGWGRGCSVKGERTFSQAELSNRGLGGAWEDEECLSSGAWGGILALGRRLGLALKCPSHTASRRSGPPAVMLCAELSGLSA